jgi:hypothetical protein
MVMGLDEITIGGPQDLPQGMLKLGQAHDRERPQIGLAGALKIELVEERFDAGDVGIAALEMELTDARLEPSVRERVPLSRIVHGIAHGIGFGAASCRLVHLSLSSFGQAQARSECT